jgi:ribonuclease G
VVRVLPGMQSAFIDIGLERTAFLHVADIWTQRTGNGEGRRPIERILAEGQSLMVQVLKDPIGTKGARLSTQISSPAACWCTCRRKSTSASRSASETRPSARRCARSSSSWCRHGRKGGFIVRTMAEPSDAELAADIAYLRKLLGRDRALRRSNPPPPSLLYEDLSLGQRVLRDLVATDHPHRRRLARELPEDAGLRAEYMPQVLPLLEHYTGERPLFDLHGVEDEIEKALARRVDLKSGGYLIIDQTEAMTTIDVNTGGFVGARNFDDTIFKTNLEAAHTIARQLRLRNLGGIIIVDFIDMENAEHREAVLAEFNKALARDHTR